MDIEKMRTFREDLLDIKVKDLKNEELMQEIDLIKITIIDLENMLKYKPKKEYPYGQGYMQTRKVLEQ